MATLAVGGPAVGPNIPEALMGMASPFQDWNPAATLQAYSQAGSAATAANAGIREAELSSQAQIKSSQAAANAQIQAAQAAAEASRYGANQQLAGIQAQLGYKQNIFNTVYGKLGGMLDSGGSYGGGNIAPPQGYTSNINQLFGGGWGGGGGGGGGFGYGGGGRTGAGLSAPPPTFRPDTSRSDAMYANLVGALGNKPNIPQFQAPTFNQAQLIDPASGPVIGKGLLNQQISNAYAQNAMMTETAIRNQRSTMGGRGLGAASPAALAVSGQLQGARIGANAQAALGAQQNAATLNAQYAQAMNQALIQQAANVYGTQMQGATSAYGTNVGALTGMYGTDIGALSSSLGSQLGYEGQMGSAAQSAQASMYGAYQQALASQYGTRMQGATSLYGTNVGYQQALQIAQIQAQASQRNAILQALSGLANA
jgi:hypothetical protein